MALKRHLAVLVSGGAIVSALVLVLALPGCGPQLPMAQLEDAGNESFARQVVPLVQGRKIKGYEEVELLSDLATLIGRDKVMRALMQQPDYVSHWSETMTDILRVHREGFQAQTGCYGAPLRGTVDGDLAEWILTHNPGAVAPGGPFNMSDVLRSSLALDNLYPLYAAHLFAMENKPNFNTEQQNRDELGATFGEVYLHRQMLCLTCHNSEESLSGAASGWDRTHPVPGFFERALYGSAVGEPTPQAFAMFRTDVRFGGSAPWGIDNSCGSFKTSVPNDPLGITAHFIQTQGQQFTIRGVQARLAAGYAELDSNGLQRTLPPLIQGQCAFCASNCTGSALDIATVANSAPNAAAVKTLLTATLWPPPNDFTCMGCHGGQAGITLSAGTDWANDLIGQPSSGALLLVNPGNANDSYLIRKLEGGPGITGLQMPRNRTPMTAAQINQVRAWINGMPALSACGVCPTLDCAQPRRHVAGNEAFAFLTAASAVNKTWTETMGSPLTIANYFPRNASQRNGLWNLTEYRFIPNDWSVQEVLRGAMNSTLFNRKAPRFSTLSSAYVLPTLFDPWTVADPRVPPVSAPGYVATDHPENHFNAVGEGVHRYSARSLLTSTHKALDWPAPQRFPPASGYPNEALEKAIGQYFTDTEPGFRGVDLQGILFWESVHGACNKPAGVTVDWIDRVTDAANAFDPASPGGPLTVQDVVVVVRDWLLGHGGIETTTPVDITGSEDAALAAHFGVALTQPASAVADLEGKLRGYCGVLTETPQFLLAGLAPSGVGPKPRMRVCNGAPCTYQEMCQALAPGVNSQLDGRDRLLCGTDSVNILHLPDIPDLVDIWAEFCPPGLCGQIDLIPDICWPELGLRAPVRSAPPAELSEPTAPAALLATSAGPRGLNACSIEPPACDPRCERIDCCGGPLPPFGKRPERLALAWVDGAQVREAEGVKRLPRGGTQLEPLRSGQRVDFGDLLVIPAKDGRLRLKTGRGEIRTPKQGLAAQGAVLMLVTGEKALRQREEAQVTRKPVLDRILRVRNSWARRGEAGNPLTLEEYRSYKYTEEEIGLDQLIKRGLWPPRPDGVQPKDKGDPPKKND